MTRSVAFVLSIMIHIVIAFLVWYEPSSSDTVPARSLMKDVVEVRLIPMEQFETSATQIEDGNGYSQISKIICEGLDQKYYGIGIIHNPSDGYITEAPPQYPAYKAGIRMLDQVIQIDERDDRRDYMQITVRRNGSEAVFHVRKDNICFQKVEPKTK